MDSSMGELKSMMVDFEGWVGEHRCEVDTAVAVDIAVVVRGDFVM